MPSPEEPLTGACACGTVRFEVTKPFDTAGYCHCKRCQRRSGALWSLNGIVGGEHLAVTQGEDAVRAWQPPNGLPKCFCGECGGHVFGGTPDGPMVVVRLGASTATLASARSGTSGCPRRPTGSRCPTTACRASPRGAASCSSRASARRRPDVNGGWVGRVTGRPGVGGVDLPRHSRKTVPTSADPADPTSGSPPWDRPAAHRAGSHRGRRRTAPGSHRGPPEQPARGLEPTAQQRPREIAHATVTGTRWTEVLA